MTRSDEGTARAATLRDYVGMVRRRKWIILQAIVLVPAATVAVSFQQEPRYQATADVLLRGNLSLSGITASALSVDTQADLARVPEIARRVADRLDIPDLDAGSVLAQTSIAPKGEESELLSFTAVGADPLIARRIATEYAHEFTRYKSELDTVTIRRARADLAKRLRQLESEGRRRSRLYDSLVAKEQELATAEALQTTNAFVVRTAEFAAQVEPRPLRNGALGLVLGVILGVGLAFLREALDTRVRSAQEITHTLDLPLLARIPEPPARLRRKDQLVMLAASRSPEAEAFRMLRTSIEMASLDREVSMIMVTSAVEGEGKSTTVANLGVAFARAGRRVILVDLDFRRPYLHRFFSVNGRPGLTQVALGRAGLRDAAVPVAVHHGLDRVEAGAYGTGAERSLSVIPTGPLPPDPGEFLVGSALAEILSALRDRADIVLIDSPPLLSAGDALALAQRVDGIVLVTKMRTLRRPMLAEVRRMLDSTLTAKLGFVVTAANADEGYGYGVPYGFHGYVREPVA